MENCARFGLGQFFKIYMVPTDKPGVKTIFSGVFGFSNYLRMELWRAACSVEEATKLGEAGFEPFVVMEGVQLFRKRK